MEKDIPITYIENAGGCIVSKNILENKGRVKWLVRGESVNRHDNGWRIFSDIDDDDFVNNPHNLVICDFNTIINIEPALIVIYYMPVGSDLQLVSENNKITFYDNITGKQIKPIY